MSSVRWVKDAGKAKRWRSKTVIFSSFSFISYQEAIDTTTPMGEAMFTIISAMAKLERDIIVQRVKAGMQKAKEKGKAFCFWATKSQG